MLNQNLSKYSFEDEFPSLTGGYTKSTIKRKVQESDRGNYFSTKPSAKTQRDLYFYLDSTNDSGSSSCYGGEAGYNPRNEGW